MRKWMVRQMYQWGPRGVTVFALLGICLVLFLVYTRPINEIPATTSKNVIPATGEQGFDAKTFCDDSRTVVSKTLAPDASGATYELKRVKDGVSETVTVVLAQTGDVLYAKHFSDAGGVQQSQPAFVDDDVKRCLERKT